MLEIFSIYIKDKLFVYIQIFYPFFDEKYIDFIKVHFKNISNK